MRGLFVLLEVTFRFPFGLESELPNPALDVGDHEGHLRVASRQDEKPQQVFDITHLVKREHANLLARSAP